MTEFFSLELTEQEFTEYVRDIAYERTAGNAVITVLTNKAFLFMLMEGWTGSVWVIFCRPKAIPLDRYFRFEMDGNMSLTDERKFPDTKKPQTDFMPIYARIYHGYGSLVDAAVEAIESGSR